MKKKISLLLVVAVMVGTLSGCVVKADEEVSLPGLPGTPPANVLPGTPPLKEPGETIIPAETVATTPPETTTTETTAPVPEEPEATQISSKPFYFNYNSDYMAFTENGKHYLYNLTTGKMTQIPMGKGGLIYAEGKLALISDSVSVQIYDIEKGELVSETDGITVSYASSVNDAVLVTKEDGDKMAFGVIGNDCEWKHELTSELAINKHEELTMDVLKDATYCLNGEMILMITKKGKFLYSYVNDTVTPLENELVEISSYNRILIREDKNIVCIDTNTGETSVVYECGKTPTIYTDNQYIFFKDKDGTGLKYVVIDKTTLKEVEFDLSAHSVYNIHGAYGDKVVFTSKKSEEEYHAVIADKSGKILADTIPGEFAIEGGVYDKASYSVYFNGDNVILNSATISGEYPDYIIDCAGGKVTKTDYKIWSVNRSGKMLVEVLDGQNKGFYLIDINNDINTLINPLDA